MLYWIAPYLTELWGPFRLFSSHMMLLAAGTLTGGLVIWSLLPRLWNRLPTDRGKRLAADGGQVSAGKPTGAGLLLALLLVPVIALFVPMGIWEFGTVVFLYLSMLFGYLDDSSSLPWGEFKKGALDLAVALGAAYCLYRGHGSYVWLPFFKQAIDIPLAVYVPGAAALLWFTMNATNCSDGVDGLAGSLTLLSLFALAGLLYGVIGYRPIADYLLIPHNPDGARWAILVATMAGSLAGYLWHNAEPSRVLMGDAGSRLLGMLVGVAVLVAGNPFLIVVVSPVVLVNGGTGLFKLILLRMFRRIGFDVRPPHTLTPEAASRQHVLIKMLHSVRFPLHDHCRKNMRWSNAQVLMRFVLIQSFLTPLLFVILVKIR
ncbi:MAG: Phospho-N-acetylmuramoyl-pentapeptide-transferase [Verrucomicrobia bacterium ADurb.Bin070]|nr:MAG: Phospho-N-acetylmuramoyl-pentapeptide-transferase [Verrucomicrobia bacterium ADurb.Bin070]